MPLPRTVAKLKNLGDAENEIQRIWNLLAQAGVISATLLGDGSVIASKVGADWPFCQCSMNGAYNVPNNVLTGAIPFDAEGEDTGACHSAVNPSRFIAPLAGRYKVWANCSFAANAAGVRGLWFCKNAAGAAAGDFFGFVLHNAVAGGVLDTGISTQASLRLVAGDYIEAFAFQNSGGALALVVNGVNGRRPRCSFQWLGP